MQGTRDGGLADRAVQRLNWEEQHARACPARHARTAMDFTKSLVRLKNPCAEGFRGYAGHYRHGADYQQANRESSACMSAGHGPEGLLSGFRVGQGAMHAD
ncbi:hypothetical protein GCM10028796_01870 [Ramlibacter monticola]